jgi:hypothetical protein
MTELDAAVAPVKNLEKRMRAFTLLGSFCVIAAMAAPASAGDQKPVKEKRICRSETGTGTIMMKMVCHTVSEWKEIDQQRSRTGEDAMDRARTGSLKSPDQG